MIIYFTYVCAFISYIIYDVWYQTDVIPLSVYILYIIGVIAAICGAYTYVIDIKKK